MPGMIHPLSISRFPEENVAGVTRRSTTEVVVYENLPGRVASLRNLVENKDANTDFGEASAKFRLFKLAPIFLPAKIMAGDFVKVVWGVKPNLFLPLTAPDWASPYLCINTPEGPDTLAWKSFGGGVYGWEGIEYSIKNSGDSWVLWTNGISGSPIYEFEGSAFDRSFTCLPWPEGFSFVKRSGRSVFYRIVKLDHQVDDLDGYHHTSLECEFEDKDGVLPV
jgi:hypothetical protein